MSIRELKALGVKVSEKGDSQTSKWVTRNTQNAMAEQRVKELEQELAATKSANEQKDQQLAEKQAANEENDRQLEEIQAARTKMANWLLSRQYVPIKITKLRMLQCTSRSWLQITKSVSRTQKCDSSWTNFNRLNSCKRNEHVLELKMSISNKETSKSELTNDLKAHFSTEKDRLLERICALEDEFKLRTDSAGSVPRTTLTIASSMTTSTSSTMAAQPRITSV